MTDIKNIKEWNLVRDASSFFLSDRGHNLILSTFGPEEDFFVKIGGPSITREFQFLNIAYQHLHELVPEPVELLRNVEFCGTGAQDIAIYRHLDLNLLDRDLAEKEASRITDGLCRIEEFFENGCNDYHENSQHGDFVPNNMGLYRKSVVILDWEDVGYVTEPGFDLSIFIASLCGFDPERILKDHVKRGSSVLSNIVDRYCERRNIQRDEIAGSIVQHMTTFLGLKRRMRYGSHIVRRLEDCCRGLDVLIDG